MEAIRGIFNLSGKQPFAQKPVFQRSATSMGKWYTQKHRCQKKIRPEYDQNRPEG